MYDDEQLQGLLTQICRQQPELPPLARQKALSRLLLHIQRSPKLWRDSHQDYAYALNQTLEWIGQNICQFKAEGLSISDSLMRWVNGRLKWRVKDLKLNRSLGPSDDRTDKEHRASRRLGFTVPVELDKVISDGKGGETRQEALTADPRLEDMTLLDQLIEKSQQARRHQVGKQIEAYLKADPHEILRTCHPRNRPDCNCQELVWRIHLNRPGETVRAIATQLAIKEQTLYHHWRYKCLPLLQLIALRHDPQVRDYVQQDPGQLLENSHPENLSACNCLELCRKLLLSEVPVNLAAAAKALGVQESVLTTHWQTQCLPMLNKNRL